MESRDVPNFEDTIFYPDNRNGYAEYVLQEKYKNDKPQFVVKQNFHVKAIHDHLINKLKLLFTFYFCICYAFFIDLNTDYNILLNDRILNSMITSEIKQTITELTESINTIINNRIEPSESIQKMELECKTIIYIFNDNSEIDFKSRLQYYNLTHIFQTYISFTFDLNLKTIEDDTDIQYILNNFKDIFLREHDTNFDPSWIIYRSNWFNETYGKAFGYHNFLSEIGQDNFPLTNIDENGLIRYNECLQNIQSDRVIKRKKKTFIPGNLSYYERIDVDHENIDSAITGLRGALAGYHSNRQSEDNFDYSSCLKLIEQNEPVDENKMFDNNLKCKIRLCNSIKKMYTILDHPNIPDAKLNNIKALYNLPYGNILKSSGLKEKIGNLIKEKNRKGGSSEYYRLHWLFHLQGIFVVVASAFYSTLTFE